MRRVTSMDARVGARPTSPATKDKDMYIILIDEHGFTSPALSIHSDHDEFLVEVEKWKKDLHETIKANKYVNGLPLGRLEASTCMVDLVRHLANYYVESTPLSFVEPGNVWSCLRLVNNRADLKEIADEVVVIKTYE